MTDKKLDYKTKNYIKKINQIISDHKLIKDLNQSTNVSVLTESKRLTSKKHARSKKRKRTKLLKNKNAFDPINVLNLSPSKSEQDSIDSLEEKSASHLEIDNLFEDSLTLHPTSVIEESKVNCSTTNKKRKKKPSHEILEKSQDKMDIGKFFKNYFSPQKKKNENPSNIFDEFGVELKNNSLIYSPQSSSTQETYSPDDIAEIIKVKSNIFDEETEVKDAKFYSITPNKKLVILSENAQLCFHGVMSLLLIHGQLEIFGYEIKTINKEYKLYSPRGSSLLYIKNITEFSSGKHHLPSLHSDLENLKNVFIKASSAVFICSKLDEVYLEFIEKHIPQQIIPKTALQFLFQPKGDWNVITTSSEWNNVAARVNDTTKMLICGGRGVGKSTFLRYTINKVLMKYKKVRVIDLDPGQAEFTVPGCISVVTITEPLLGVNYTHLKTPDRSILSDINVGNSPALYIKSIQHLMYYVNNLKSCPILINYMGFNQGIGLNIISSAISIIQPSEVVQIQSCKKKKNFILPLTRHVIKQNVKLFSQGLGDVSLDYELIEILSMSDGKEGWTLEPRQMREMCILSYFGQIMNSSVLSVLSSDLPLYKTSLDSINIVGINGAPLETGAANASLVALCKFLEHAIFECFGWGIVRGIDAEKNTVVIMSPISESLLENVTHLVVGNIFLPPSVYMTVDNLIGLVPYVQLGEMDSLGKVTKRSYLPVNKK